MHSVSVYTHLLATALVASVTTSAYPVFEDKVFWFGSASTNTQDGTPSNPHYTGWCRYVVLPDDGDVCYATEVQTQHNTGGCPGQNLKGTDFCGQKGIFPEGVPTSFYLNPDDPCGIAQTKLDGKTPAKGVTYATVLDADDNDMPVGICEYDRQESKNCFRGYEAVLGEKFIKCSITIKSEKD